MWPKCDVSHSSQFFSNISYTSRYITVLLEAFIGEMTMILFPVIWDE